MNATTRQIAAENIVAADRAQAQAAARERVLAEMAGQAPHSYIELRQASRNGSLAGLLAELPSAHELRLCAAAVALETGAHIDLIEEKFSRLLEAARWAA